MIKTGCFLSQSSLSRNLAIIWEYVIHEHSHTAVCLCRQISADTFRQCKEKLSHSWNLPPIIYFSNNFGTRQKRNDRELLRPLDPFFLKWSLLSLGRKLLITPSRYPPYIINMGNLDVGFQSLQFLLSENTSVLIFLCSQPVKMLHIFSAPIQRNLSFTPYFMPYVGSWKNEGFSCQSLKAAQALFQLHTALDLKVWHFTLASVSTICSVSLVHCWKYSW